MTRGRVDQAIRVDGGRLTDNLSRPCAGEQADNDKPDAS